MCWLEKPSPYPSPYWGRAGTEAPPRPLWVAVGSKHDHWVGELSTLWEQKPQTVPLQQSLAPRKAVEARCVGARCVGQCTAHGEGCV